MKKIASFTVDHLKLYPGLYVSRKDQNNGVVVTTFDLRFTRPNFEKCLDGASMHTIEHLGATYLRNSISKDNVVYFGPMGCKTGFYLVMFNDLTSSDVKELVCGMLRFIINFEGDIPGASPEECGNYSYQNLQLAKLDSEKYLHELVTYNRLNYN